MEAWSLAILLFFIYAVMGWLWETVYCSLKARKYVYRGFLFGPYCPIYGFGVVMVLYLMDPLKEHIIWLFLLSAVLVSILEYLTSYFLEKFFHATWWDYHDVPLNIGGRIAVPVSLFWGFGCTLIVKVINPEVEEFANWLYGQFGFYLPAIITILMLIDTVKSVTSMVGFQKAIGEFRVKMEHQAEELRSTLEKRTAEFEADFQKGKHLHEKENWKLAHGMRPLRFSERRMLKAFPNMKLKQMPHFENLRSTLLKLDDKKRKEEKE
ncbi:putative ABC transporter permease [Listeria costaricensis]|uniref:putative ABC transporter permease n=1 Tax=Listeria costaricensis TaxID=2026604 RepID=UPI000C087C84|nr:hypothetical protein [Listeria costaricensis]